MSEKLSIQEAGKSRNFSGVGVIETETPEGDSCFWVPESERELETEYVIKNGTYRPKKYGFSDIDVNVFDLTTDLDGNDWKIDISDIDMPDISLPDFDIDLSLDLDGMPNIDFGIHIITVDDDEIKVVVPGGEEMIIHGPSLTEPIVILNAIKISYDPSTGEWTVEALVDCTVGDTTYNPGDVIKTWPGTEKVDFYIQVGIALPDLSETIDLDAGFDVSLDVGDMGNISADITGIDLDGFDVDVNIDLDTLDIETEYLPDTIKILTPPNKLEYRDGEPIDLTGAVVSAYYKGGTEVWANEKYPNGIIPLGELIVEPKNAKYDNQQMESDIGVVACDDKPIEYKYGLTRWGNTYHSNKPYYQEGSGIIDRPTYEFKSFAILRRGTNTHKGNIVDEYDNCYGWLAYHRDDRFDYTHNNKTVCLEGIFFLGYDNVNVIDPNHNLFVDAWSTYSCPQNGYVLDFETICKMGWTAVYGQKREKTDSKIKLSWPRPKDGKVLSTSFDVTVEAGTGDSGSTHHSGTWGDDDTGHFGGTTISGNYGGSHSNGKF